MSSNVVTSQDIALEIDSVEKSYGSFKALRSLDLEVRRSELLTLLGPSGSGKTTLLKAIAGFETIDEGAILVDGVNVAGLPPARRDIGMVFQNYALFPHMTVAENVAFPLRMRRRPKNEIAERVAEVLRRVDLPSHGERYPGQLSGGQQQRVALARAIVFGPKLLLLDEPFGALDRKLREGMQQEVRDLQQRLELTTIFITHDQEEAQILSDRIAVMEGGRLLQVGEPDRIYSDPADLFTASFLGESNLLAAAVTGIAADGLDLALDVGVSCRAPLPVTGAGAIAVGDRVTLLVRPEALVPADGGRPTDVRVKARLVESRHLGNTVKWRLVTEGRDGRPGVDLVERHLPGDVARNPAPGEIVELGWASRDGRVLVS